MELHLGFMHKNELAEFFHKSPKSFMNHKPTFDKYCTILEDYAVFIKVRGGVEIISIHNDGPYDEVSFDFDKGIEEALEKAEYSKYFINGKICTAGYVLNYIIETQATAKDKEIISKDYERISHNLKQRINYRLRKEYSIFEDEVLEQYFDCIDENKQVVIEYKGKGLIPLVYEKRNGQKVWREVTKEEKERLDELLDEEVKNNAKNSQLALYHLAASAKEYKGAEKNYVEQSKKLCRPFYRAIERLNKEKSIYYIPAGSIVFREGKTYIPKEITKGEFDF